MIGFNIPPSTGKEIEFIKKAMLNNRICGNGEFTLKCSKWIKEESNAGSVFLTTSCTTSLEMSAVLAGIKPGDEVIMPAFTFVSTADAFVGRGAKIVFVDIRPDTMNIDENLIEDAITEKTKAIVPVHYAGVACEMDKIMQIAKKHNLIVIEDAAQGMMSKYKGKTLGAIGDFGCYSFHETKNYSMGEGGAILIKDENLTERAEIIREKGTNRSKFFRGQIDKYTWVEWGASYLPSEINAAFLWPQLLEADKINQNRLNSWNMYNEGLEELEKLGYIQRPTIPEGIEHNAHMYYIKVKDLEERTKLIKFLQYKDIQAVFHYVPLHTAPAGKKYGRFNGEDIYTTKESERLLRLPMYYNIKKEDVAEVIDAIKEFYN